MTAVSVSAPSITSIVFNQNPYTSGQTIQATVTYVKGTSETPVVDTRTGTLTDSVSGESGSFSETFTEAGPTVSDATTPTVADTNSLTWTKVSDTGTVAVFTATAGTASGTLTATATDTVTNTTGTGTGGYVVTVGSNPLISTLVDNLSANDLTTNFGNSAGMYTYSTGEVGIKVDTAYDSYLESTITDYTLIGSSIYVKLSPYLASGSATALYLNASSGNNLWFGQTGTNLAVYKTIGGTQTALFDLTYNATNHIWLRIRESGGTTYFDTAPDSSNSPGTWTNQYSTADSTFTFGLTSLSVQILCGDYSANPVGTSYLYAVNASAVSPSPPPPPSNPSPPSGYVQTYTHDFTTGGMGDWVTQPGAGAAVAIDTTNGLGITVAGDGQWAEIISSNAVITADCFVQAELYIPLDGPTGEVCNWPAWWTTGTNWPVNGEIDILEGQIGYASLQTHYGTLQTNGTASQNSPSEQAPFGTGGWLTVSMLRTGGQATAWYGTLEVGTVPMPATANHQLIFQNQGYNASYPTFHGPLDYPVTAYLKNVTVWSESTDLSMANPFKYVSNAFVLSPAASSHAFAVTTATAKGDTLVVAAMTNGTAQYPTSITDSAGNVYTQKTTYHSVSPSIVVFESPGATGGSGGGQTAALTTSSTLTVTLNASSSLTITVCAVDAGATGAFDQLVGPTHSSGVSNVTVNVTPTVANETLIAFTSVSSTGGASPAFVSPTTDLGAAGVSGGPWIDAGYQVLSGGSGTAHALESSWSGTANPTITGVSIEPPSAPPVGQFIGFVNHITNDGGMAGVNLTTSYSNGNSHTDFPGGGSPQTNQSLPCHFEAFTDYLQEFPWPTAIAMMSSPNWTGPSETGLTNCVAALYLGSGMGTPSSVGGYPVYQGQLTNPGALTNLPVPAGTWAGAPKMANGTAAIPAVPMVGWNLGGASLVDIANGVYDTSTIIPCAQACKNWPADSQGNPAYSGQPGGQIIIRLMHEMNGPWAPYCPNSTGETCANFVSAWQHIVQVFANQGATNARWLWCPNVCSSGAGTNGPTPWSVTSGTCKLLYPGDAYVDYVGLDGYNKNPPNWQTFSQVFQNSYNFIYNGDAYTSGPITTTKPMILGEIGCFEADEFTSPPQTKAQWIASIAPTVTASMPNVIGGFWWHENGGTGAGLEFYVDSSSASQAAWATLANSWTGRIPVIQGVTTAL